MSSFTLVRLIKPESEVREADWTIDSRMLKGIFFLMFALNIKFKSLYPRDWKKETFTGVSGCYRQLIDTLRTPFLQYIIFNFLFIIPAS